MRDVVTALLPALSRSLAEEFNVFRVMHHGTHEKQLSNVFAWLLAAESTRHLGDAFQQTHVSLAEGLDGLPQNDRRLCDAVLSMAVQG